jgi:hypothetical protein
MVSNTNQNTEESHQYQIVKLIKTFVRIQMCDDKNTANTIQQSNRDDDNVIL